eukprot:CAMPEP_0197278172 /NCGR_PEP_ID=MMETSP1432-20130617/18246_1 /TAXON_ID=44447 /ORGANISM="Pseudo-nitzschia delicatissima, Strain UNC1205" /LENGTH=365 /DNA_ID=CAMNT_0042744509 /DNA_START=82 /DNA_END=1179 /DNA_ORIENTATION=+
MGMITCYAKKVEKRRSKYSFPNTQRFQGTTPSFQNAEQYPDLSSPRNEPGSPAAKIMNAIRFWLPLSPRNNGNNMSADVDKNISSMTLNVSVHSTSNLQRRRKSNRSKDRMAEINKQALLYIGSYILSYGFVWAMSLHSLATKKPPLTWLRVLSAIFFPLQGFINIFIYCRPHIVSLRALFPDEYTWFQAFVMVLKSGGDDPLSAQERRSTSVTRFQSNRNFNSTTSRVVSDKSIMEMDSDSSTNDSTEAATQTLGKKSSTTLPAVDIENQSVESKNDVVDDLVDGIPLSLESLENVVHDAEKILDDALEAFMDLADEKQEKRQSDSNDYMEDDYSAVSDVAFATDDQDASSTADETSTASSNAQ